MAKSKNSTTAEQKEKEVKEVEVPQEAFLSFEKDDETANDNADDTQSNEAHSQRLVFNPNNIRR